MQRRPREGVGVMCWLHYNAEILINPSLSSGASSIGKTPFTSIVRSSNPATKMVRRTGCQSSISSSTDSIKN